VLTGSLVHPGILRCVAAAGHGSLILVADGNFPASTSIGPHAELIHVGITAGMPSVVQVVSPLLDQVRVEAVIVMQPDTEGPFATSERPRAWSEIESLLSYLPGPIELSPVPRQDFYELASSAANALTVVTADTAWFSNVLLRIGPRPVVT
jgi:L-fucose mutarotase